MGRVRACKRSWGAGLGSESFERRWGSPVALRRRAAFRSRIILGWVSRMTRRDARPIVPEKMARR